MDDLRFYVLFNSISVISGKWADGNERLHVCAMESRFQLKRFCSHFLRNYTKTWSLDIIPVICLLSICRTCETDIQHCKIIVHA